MNTSHRGAAISRCPTTLPQDLLKVDGRGPRGRVGSAPRTTKTRATSCGTPRGAGSAPSAASRHTTRRQRGPAPWYPLSGARGTFAAGSRRLFGCGLGRPGRILRALAAVAHGSPPSISRDGFPRLSPSKVLRHALARRLAWGRYRDRTGQAAALCAARAFAANRAAAREYPSSRSLQADRCPLLSPSRRERPDGAP